MPNRINMLRMEVGEEHHQQISTIYRRTSLQFSWRSNCKASYLPNNKEFWNLTKANSIIQEFGPQDSKELRFAQPWHIIIDFWRQMPSQLKCRLRWVCSLLTPHLLLAAYYITYFLLLTIYYFLTNHPFSYTSYVWPHTAYVLSLTSHLFPLTSYLFALTFFKA